MYTRVYPTGKNNLHIDSVNSNVSYLDRNTATYGVIAQVITDSTIGSPALLKAWAEKQLKKNAEPKYTVSITGYELSESTGEKLDKLIAGRLCRIPLPEYGVTITERLTELSWKDPVNQPEAVTCTLANELKTITGVLNEQARGGGGGGKKANTEHDCELGEDEEKIEEFENADIWINRDSIWAVCGCYTVTTTSTGKKLKVNDGTALVLERNGTEWGVYDQGNLTGGIMIQKINGTTETTIRADKINIDGVVTALAAKQIAVLTMHTTGGSNLFEGHCSFPDTVSMQDLTYQNLAVNWKSTSVVTSISHGSTGSKTWALDGGSTWQGSMLTWVLENKTTLHYLGD